MDAIFYEHEADQNDYFWTWKLIKNNTPPHFHKALELIYCVKGSMSLFIDKQRYILKENDMCFIPSYTVHSNSYIDEDNMIHSFLFAHNFFHDFEKTFPLKSLPILLLDSKKNEFFYNDLMNMFNVYASYGYRGNNIPFLQRQALVNDLLLKLTKSYPLIPATEVKENQIIIDILKFIDNNYKEDLTLPVIAKKFNYSPKYFSALFKTHVGCTLTEYLHNVRIKNIFLQMESPTNKHTITALALENGFNSLATFYRVLKQTNTQTPNL